MARSSWNSYLHLDLTHSVIEQQINNNRTKVRLTLKLVHNGNGIYFSTSKSGNLHGQGFTYTGGFSGTGSRTLRTRDVWVKHNSDGSKRQTFNASFNPAISFGGSSIGNRSVSLTVNLPNIPRKTELNSASITSLRNGHSSTLSIGRSVKHSGFYHLVTIMDGGTWIWDTGYFKGNPSTSYSIKASTVEKMLSRMRTTTSKTFRVRLRTYTGNNGSGLIGTEFQNITASVNSNVKPSASNLSYSEDGNNVTSHILQSISRIKASFSGSAGYGASISSRYITVRRNSGNANSQRINGDSGTTSSPVSLTGTYEVIGTVVDSRGRSDTVRKTFTVTGYSPPRITEFTAKRKENAQTTVSLYRSGTHSGLDGQNTATMTLEYRGSTGGSWITIGTPSKSTGSFDATKESTGHSVTQSYDFRATFSDEFGNTSHSVVSVPTQRVVLDVHKNEGVGIGKIHERGVLDVDGEAHFRGPVSMEGQISFKGGIDAERIPRNADLNDYTGVGFYYNNYNTDTKTMSNTPINEAFSLLVERHAGNIQTFTTYGGASGETSKTYQRNFYSDSWGPWVRTDTKIGSNSNGNWVRFGNGLQICEQDYFLISYQNQYSVSGRWTFPVSFSDEQFVVIGTPRYTAGEYRGSTVFSEDRSKTQTKITLGMDQSMKADSGYRTRVDLIAIGRWK